MLNLVLIYQTYETNSKNSRSEMTFVHIKRARAPTLSFIVKTAAKKQIKQKKVCARPAPPPPPPRNVGVPECQNVWWGQEGQAYLVGVSLIQG